MEELLDTYDIDGNFLGVKPRSFCHSENPGCYHKAVWIWIINDRGKYLFRKEPLPRKSLQINTICQVLDMSTLAKPCFRLA